MKRIVVDGNEAAARVAYQTHEAIAIYPITPASNMAEWADAAAAAGLPNLWGQVPGVVQLQSEAGAAGTLHGILQAGGLATTFTASQGLLLMLPNLYKIAGELTAAVIHVAARTVATHALSIFGDHSDVMAARATGWGMLFAGSVQEVHDFALIAQAASLRSRIPFLHVFDGFRTSHEMQKIDAISGETLRATIDEDLVGAHRARGLDPDRPVIRGTSQNPDAFFQSREAAEPFYRDAPNVVRREMERFAERTGRRYDLFDYVGSPRAERVLILMGSGAETVHKAVETLAARGEAVGMVKVRLFRPFSGIDLVRALPESVRSIAVLDRTKEPGSAGEPLYQDVVTALAAAQQDGLAPFRTPPRVVGGRYGLSGKAFSSRMVKGIFDRMAEGLPPGTAERGRGLQHPFTVGIRDDVSGSDVPPDPEFTTGDGSVYRALFLGLGSDGTVGACKNTVRILGAETDKSVQGFFEYDSKKAGSVTTSHLRFGPGPIRSTYRIKRADFVAVHHASFLEKGNPFERALPGGTCLLDLSVPPEEAWDLLPREAQQTILDRRLRLWCIDAHRVAREAGIGGRINIVMQVCFFRLSGLLPLDRALDAIRDSIRTTYARKGEETIRRNLRAVDAALDPLHEVPIPEEVTATESLPEPVPRAAPAFVRETIGPLIAFRGDELPVSAFPPDGTYPTGTAAWERRNIALEIPLWDPARCIQCNRCVLICPHAAIRAKVVPHDSLADAPEGFRSMPSRAGRDLTGTAPEDRYLLQVAPEDCTGCALCVEFCPVEPENGAGKPIGMVPQPPIRRDEAAFWDFFRGLPEADRTAPRRSSVKGSQFLQPLFEFSGACAGCGETPYVKLLSQLFGDRALVANATGCSSIYGGNLPTTPWTTDPAGRGPAWSNSLFEDAAEFGYGFRLAWDRRRDAAVNLLREMREAVGTDLADALLAGDSGDGAADDEKGIRLRREQVAELRKRLRSIPHADAGRLAAEAHALIPKSVWVVGGDGWAYDIGFGGVDHVLRSGGDVNLLVLDTGAYSNTGGQLSKATPRGATAKFASAGRTLPRKDLSIDAVVAGGAYVAQVALGADPAQTVRAFLEAASYPGPSMIVAYSPCIAHGIDMRRGPLQSRLAVESGEWPLFRFDPRRIGTKEGALQLDSPAGPPPDDAADSPKARLAEFRAAEGRFRVLAERDPDRARRLLEAAWRDVGKRRRILAALAEAFRSETG